MLEGSFKLHEKGLHYKYIKLKGKKADRSFADVTHSLLKKLTPTKHKIAVYIPLLCLGCNL